jgi:hypothetical protein
MTRRMLPALAFAFLWVHFASAAIVNFTGFETGDLTETMSTATTGTGSVAASGSIVDSGEYAMDTNAPAATDTASFQLRRFDAGGLQVDGTVDADSYVKARLYVETAPGTGDEPIMRMLTSGAVNKIELRLTDTGLMRTYLAGTGTNVTGDGSTPIVAGSFYCIQWRVQSHGSTGIYTVHVNGDEEINTTGNTNLSGTGRYEFGKTSNRNSNAVRYRWDNIVISNTAMPACDTTVARMDVDGDGAATAWTIGAGAGSDFQNVDDVPHDGNTTYLLSTGVDGDASMVSLEAASAAGITGTIHAVKPYLAIRRDNTVGSTQGTIQLRLRSNTTNSDGVDSSVNPGVAGNVDIRQLVFETDPATTAAWASVSVLDSIQVGIVEAEVADKTRWTAGNAHILFTGTGGGPGGGTVRTGLLMMGTGK